MANGLEDSRSEADAGSTFVTGISSQIGQQAAQVGVYRVHRNACHGYRLSRRLALVAGALMVLGLATQDTLAIYEERRALMSRGEAGFA